MSSSTFFFSLLFINCYMCNLCTTSSIYIAIMFPQILLCIRCAWLMTWFSRCPMFCASNVEGTVRFENTTFPYSKHFTCFTIGPCVPIWGHFWKPDVFLTFCFDRRDTYKLSDKDVAISSPRFFLQPGQTTLNEKKLSSNVGSIIFLKTIYHNT